MASRSEHTIFRGLLADRRRAGRRAMSLGAAALLGLGLAACGTFNNFGQDVAIVRDLSSVAGCRFMGTVGAPATGSGLRVASAYTDYLEELRRRTRAMGGTHLYLLNEAAGWGAASAVGTAYLCRT